MQVKNKVSTNVVRTGYISAKYLNAVADAKLVFEHNDTVAVINSTCGNPRANYSIPLSTFIEEQSRMLTSTGIRTSSLAPGNLVGYVYDFSFPNGVQMDHLDISTRIASFKCTPCDANTTVQVCDGREQLAKHRRAQTPQRF